MRGERILIIDDNLQNQKLARVLLQTEGYEVRTAGSAEEALRMLDDFTPALILMDLQLPHMDGLELTRILKADSRRRSMVIVALTAYAMKGDDQKAFAAGCDDYVTKPIDIERLPKTVRAHLERAAVERAEPSP